MIECPYCGTDNIDGADACEQCHQPLDYLSKPRPATEIEERLLRDRIHMLPPAAPLIVESTATVAEVLDRLVSHSVGCAIVVEEGRLAGVFSERDVLLKLGTQTASLRDKPISDFMTVAPETLEEQDKIAFALHKMDVGGYRHLPIMKDGAVSGIISIRDILRYITDHVLSPTA